MSVRVTIKLCTTFLLLHLVASTAIGEFSISKNLIFDKISPYALRGNDTTLVLLDNINPSINFDLEDKLAFEYLIVKAQYYLNNYSKENLLNTLSEAKAYYSGSDNKKLKLWYDIKNSYYHGFPDKETRLKDCIVKAEELNEVGLLVEATITLAFYYQNNSDNSAAEFYYKKALNIAEENSLIIEQAIALESFAKYYYKNLEYDIAIKLFDRAKTIYYQEGYEVSLAKVIGHEATILRKKSFYTEALKSYQQILTTYEKFNQTYHIAKTHEYIGLIMKQMGSHEDAIRKFKLALNFVTLQSNPGIYIRLNRHIGETYYSIGNYTEAESYLRKSLGLRKEIKNTTNKLELNHRYCHNSLGYLYLKQGTLDKAEIQFNKTIKLSGKLKSTTTLDKAYLGLSEIYFEKKEFKKARKYGAQALFYSKKNKEIELEHATLSFLSSIETKLGNHKQSNQYHKQADSLQDSILNFEEVMNFTNVMADYKNQAMELENLNLKNENQQKEAAIRENNLRSRLYQLGFVSVLITLLLFGRNYFQKIKSNQKLKELNNSLHSSNDQLEQSNDELERFAHKASHDLKSPLRTITSFSSILQKRVASKLDDKEEEYFNFISKSGKNLSVMIDDMLSYSKVGSQKLVLQEVDLNKELKDIITTLKNQANEKAVTLKQLTSFPVVMADQQKLRRVFLNIGYNAIKFCDTTKDSRYVHFSYDELPDHHQFAIADNGIGIPKTDKNIFEPFTHLNPKDDYEGTGMGLAMCEKIIHKHGGQISYKSELGKSTVFYFNIKKHVQK